MLKELIVKHKISQAAIATACGVSKSAISQALKHNKWPVNSEGLQQKIIDFLNVQGVAATTDLFNNQMHVASTDSEELMLLRKQRLSQAAKKHFGLFKDPFAEDLQSHEDVFLTPDIRFVRESMYMTAKHGGFLAVIGESGAGKSTLRRDMIDRIQRESQSIIVIEPYVLALEDNDIKGKTLKAAHIAEAILSTLSPLENPKRSPEARFRQLHRVLKDSKRAGNSHVLIIEEAHALPIPTIKHLKRFFELEDGFQKLLSIVLIGQPELSMKLSEQNQEVREVVQRCEIVNLTPLINNHLDEYLKFKVEKVGGDFTKVFEKAALDALNLKMTVANRRGSGSSISLAYPLAVGNLVTACMNMAADFKAPSITADIVNAV